MTINTKNSTPPRGARIWILLGLCILVGLLWAANWYFALTHIPTPTERGQFGDMFGAVNALFTALAFAGLIYTVLLQRDQLALQQQEIAESGRTQRELVTEQIEAQEKLFEQQKDFQEEQREKRVEHEKKLEQLRQDFEDIVEGRRKDREQASEEQFRSNMLRAIRFELEALGSLYSNASGLLLRQVAQGEFHQSRFLMTQNFLSVFEANAVHLGRIEAEMSRQIITVYTLLKALVEEYVINNQYLAQADQIEAQAKQGLGQPNIERQREANRGLLVTQAVRLKRADALLESETKKLFALLDASGVL